MIFSLLDWLIIGGYLLFSLIIGLLLKNKASKDLSSFFLGGRNLPWYIAGISMVATTFAADTPLWVTERVAQNGISGNWLWWNMLIGGMLTTFFFAKYWRKAGVLTELELIELRYSGKAAQFLRGFKSVYLGLFMNTVIIGWVNMAMIKILEVFFEIPASSALLYTGGLMILVMIYSGISGLLGVAITDTVQFFIAMTGSIILAVILLNHEKIGGIEGLKNQLPSWRLDFFPKITSSDNSGSGLSEGVFQISLSAFLTFALVQWWASWYPGAEPGGGGYIAQRMMSAKNEQHAVLASLFFQIAHYCLRPWPWILAALCSLILYPDLPLNEAGKGYVLSMRDYLPQGLRGLLFVAFLAAYMSTISTQLNWGAGYITNDLYKRFIAKNHNEKHYVKAAKWITIFIAFAAFGVTTQIETIDQAAKFLIESGAGLGLVLILRWYWWRINAWSEIAATIAPVIGYFLFKYVFDFVFPYSFLLTVSLTTVCWILVTFLTPPVKKDTLEKFYHTVQPSGFWQCFGNIYSKKQQTLWLFLAWISSLGVIYALLFLSGYIIFHEWTKTVYSIVLLTVSGIIFGISLKKSHIIARE
ncbi:MAG: sodium:proline symporter [Bacteroidetes bacterium]|nr:MAG: sodium:proline symporter [Bacteroidota bacterium]